MRLRSVALVLLRLKQSNLVTLGVHWDNYATLNYTVTQAIGAAVAFLGCDGLIAPSARWSCENLMLFPTNQAIADELTVINSDKVMLRDWASKNNFLADNTD